MCERPAQSWGLWSPTVSPLPSQCPGKGTHWPTASGAGTCALGPAATWTSPRWQARGQGQGRRSRSCAGCGGRRSRPEAAGAGGERAERWGGEGPQASSPAPTPNPRRRRGCGAARATRAVQRPRPGARVGRGEQHRVGGSRRGASGPRTQRRVLGARTVAGAPRASPCPGGWVSGGPRGRAAPARAPASPGSGPATGRGWPLTAPSTAAHGSAASPGPGQEGHWGQSGPSGPRSLVDLKACRLGKAR